MDNGQMARWLAQTEHFEQIESHKRHEALLRDIQSEDFNVRITHTAGAKQVQKASAVSFIKRQLATLTARVAAKPVSALDCTGDAYEKNCV